MAQTIKVTQLDGTQPVRLGNDAKFLQGFSPIVEVSEAADGFNITITDAEGAKTFFLPSGNAITPEQIQQAVEDYLAENPVSGGATAEQAAQIEMNKTAILELANALADRYTKAETNEAIKSAIEGIELPEPELSDYYTKEQTDSAIKEAVENLDVPDTEGLASKEYVREYAQPKGSYLTEESDPTVPAWAKKPEKPTYTASEVGALPDTTEIPTVPANVSAFANDAGYVTETALEAKGYQTASQVSSLINSTLGVIENGAY